MYVDLKSNTPKKWDNSCMFSNLSMSFDTTISVESTTAETARIKGGEAQE